MNPLVAQLLGAITGAPRADAEVQQLARVLNVSADELLRLPTDPRYCYRQFTIRKRHGGERRLAAPSSPLKKLQRRFLHGYLAQQHLHDAATAFRPHASIATHARRHLGQAVVLTVDLADFFPATSAHRIRHWFVDKGWCDQSLYLLMRLCVYQGGLPQGAPTSPALSNLVNRQLDEQLSERAAMSDARYSRYADDLAFSWSGDDEPLGFRQQVEDTLLRFGYRINLAKGWRRQLGDERPEITGLVLDGRRLRLPARVLACMRALKSRWRGRTPKEDAQWQGYRGLLRMLKR